MTARGSGPKRVRPSAQEVERVAKAIFNEHHTGAMTWREAGDWLRKAWHPVARAAIRAMSARTGKGKK